MTSSITLFNPLIFKRYFGEEADTGGVSSKLLKKRYFGEEADTDVSNKLPQGQRHIPMEGMSSVVKVKSSPTKKLANSSVVPNQDMPSIPSLVVETDPAMSSSLKSCTKVSSPRMPNPRMADHLNSEILLSLHKIEREINKWEFDRVGMKQNDLRKVCNRVGLNMSVNEADMLWATFGKTLGSKINIDEFCAHFKRLRTSSKNNTLRPNSAPGSETYNFSKNDTLRADNLTPRPPSRQQMSSRQHRLRMQMQSQNK
jgi:hypothetical protein